VPLIWALLYEGQISAETALWAQLGLQFVDGTQVAVGNCVDIDCGGMDALSRSYGLALNDGLRNRSVVSLLSLEIGRTGLRF